MSEATMETGSAEAFIRAHTALAPVPMARDIVLYTASDVLPIWRATEAWLAERNIGVPFWCVPWAGGQALARYVLDHPETVRGKSVLDFGAGSGLVAIAAARAGAARVRAVDIDAIAIAACKLNAAENGVALDSTCADLTGSVVDVDIVLAGDVWYEREPAARFGGWLASLVSNGTRVVTGDPGRHYVPEGVRVLATYEVPTPWELESAHSRTSRVLDLLAP